MKESEEIISTALKALYPSYRINPPNMPFDGLMQLQGRKFAVEIKGNTVNQKDASRLIQALAVAPQEGLIVIAPAFEPRAIEIFQKNGIVQCISQNLENLEKLVAYYDERAQLGPILWNMKKKTIEQLGYNFGIQVVGTKEQIIERILQLNPSFDEIRKIHWQKIYYTRIYFSNKIPESSISEFVDSIGGYEASQVRISMGLRRVEFCHYARMSYWKLKKSFVKMDIPTNNLSFTTQNLYSFFREISNLPIKSIRLHLKESSFSQIIEIRSPHIRDVNKILESRTKPESSLNRITIRLFGIWFHIYLQDTIFVRYLKPPEETDGLHHLFDEIEKLLLGGEPFG